MKSTNFARAAFGGRVSTALAALVLTAVCHGQLAQTAWPKYHGDGLNDGASTAKGAMPVLKWQSSSGSSIQGSLSLGGNGKLYGSVVDLGLLTSLVSFDINTGATTTLVPLLGDAASTPTLGMDGNLYAHTALGLYSVSPATGSLHWLNVALSSSQSSPAVGSDGTLYVGNLLSFYAVDSTTGIPKWGKLVLGDVVSTPAIGGDGTVYMSSGNTKLYALNPTNGATLWSFSTNGYLQGSPSLDTAGNVYIASNAGRLYKLNAATGAQIWSQDFGGHVYSTPALGTHNDLYVTSDSGIYGVNATTGAIVWSSSPHGGYYGSASVDANQTVYAVDNSAGYVSAFRGTDGSLMWSYPVGTNSAPGAPIMGDDGTLYVAAAGGAAAAYAFDTFNNAVFTIDNTGIVGGANTTGTISLPGNAVADMTISLASQNSSFLSMPASVTIPAGSNSVSFPITSKTYANTYAFNLKASYDGVTKSKLVTVYNDHIASLSLNPSTVRGGDASTATVSLAFTAPVGGWKVNVSSSNANFVTTPTTVTVPAGSTSATFTVASKAYQSSYTSNIKVQDGTTLRSAVLMVVNNAVSSIVLTPSTVKGGDSTTATVKLQAKAPAGGFTVDITTGNPAFVGVPASLTIPEGATQASFTVTTKSHYKVYSTAVKANDGKYQVGATLTVNP